MTLRDRNVEPKAYVGIEPLKKKKKKIVGRLIHIADNGYGYTKTAFKR